MSPDRDVSIHNLIEELRTYLNALYVEVAAFEGIIEVLAEMASEAQRKAREGTRDRLKARAREFLR